jgi:fatty acid amide hydrolase
VDLFFGIATADRLGFVRDLLAGEPPVPLMKPNMQLMSLPRLLLPLVKAALRLSGQARLHRMLSCGAPAKSADGLLRLLYQRAVFEGSFLRGMAARRFDAVLCPALPIAAPPHGTVNDMADFWGSALLFNVLGFPAGVAPVTRVRAAEQSDRAPSRDKAVDALRRAEQGSAGLPVAVQIAAPPWREDTVLALLMALERECAAGAEYPGAPPL